MAERVLQCWWDSSHIADITARRPWDLRLRYTPTAQERWPTNTPALSCSLPVQSRPLRASAFLRGLLPEGRHLQALADLAGVATNDTFRLLARYGRDVAGALVITDGDEPPSGERSAAEPYTDETLAAEVAGLDEHPLGVRADSELSIAGLQDKLLLVDLGAGRWGRPVNGHASTHILKVDDDRFPGLVTAEAACLRLAQAVGLSDLDPVTLAVGDATCIIVKRYDRTVVDDVVHRLHQEDACQALGIDPQDHRGRAKYEDAGGPSWAQIARLLVQHAIQPQDELDRLLRTATFTGLVGNADAHGKNISLLHDGEGHISLAPLYDTVPTVLWPKLRATAAMSVNGERSFERIGVDALVAEAERWGLRPDRGRASVVALAEACRQQAATIDHDDLASFVMSRSEALLDG